MQTSSYRTLFNFKTHKSICIIRSASVNTTPVSAAGEGISVETKPWKKIPGPNSLPFIGPLFNLLPGGPLYNVPGKDLWRKLYEMYGPIVRLDAMIGAPAIVFLYDPESASKILRGENSLPVRPGFLSLEYYRKQHKEKDKRQASLITDHGDVWKQFRSKVNPVMLKPKTIELYTSVIDEVAMDMIKRLKSLRNEENIIQSKFDVEMNLWALESIGIVALGGRLNCFDPNLAEDSPARRLIKCVHELFKVADDLDFKPGIWRYYPTKTFKRAMKLYEEHEELGKYFIEKAKKDLLSKNRSSEAEKGILEKLLEIDENIANVMASDMLFAGVDTAAHTMIGTLYLLAVNPEKQTRLRQELLSKQDKKYLRATIKEAMRIMPVVGGNIRKTTKDYKLLGYHVPKGTSVALSHWFMSTHESNFPKPLEFIPERWLALEEDPIYYGNSNPFAFNPFGFGVRSCIGRRIAELEVATFLTRMIENFEVGWFGPPPEVTTTSLNYVTGPFNFILKEF